MPCLTVSLVTWNGERDLPDCLESLHAQRYKDVEVIVLDNGSRDRTRTILKEREAAGRPPLRLIAEDHNTGFAQGHNRVIRVAQGAYILILNQDVVLAEDYLDILISFLEGHRRAGAASGKLLRLGEVRNPLPQPRQGARIDTMGLLLRPTLRVLDRGAGEEDRGQYDAVSEVFGVSAAAALYRRGALEDVAMPRRDGGREYFDEDFFSYKEDVDLAWRLQLRSWDTWVIPTARAWHRRGVGSESPSLVAVGGRYRERSPLARYYSYRNHLLVLLKDPPLAFAFLFSFPVTAVEGAKVLYLLLRDPRTLRGVWSYLALAPRMLAKWWYIQRRRTASLASLLRWISW